MLKDQHQSLSTHGTSFETFTAVVEKLMKNKLNKTNAFENRLIDTIEDVFGETEKDLEDAWQKYSMGIDSCGKIYGMCVDQIYAEAFQVLAGLNRSVGEQEKEGKEEVKGKKIIMCGKGTLETDESCISVGRVEKGENCEFRSFSNRFDAHSFAGLLLNTASVTDGLDLVILEEEPQRVAMDIDENPEIAMEMNEINTAGDIFPGIQKFLTYSLQENIENALESITQANDLFENSVSEDSAPEDLLENENFEEIQQIEHKFLITAPQTIGIQEKLEKFQEFDDYHFTKTQKNDWAGLEYWKKVKNTEKVTANKKKVESSLVLSLTSGLHKEKVFEPCRKGTTNYFSANSVKKSEDLGISLPEDYNFSLGRLTQLFTKPQTFVKFEKNSEKNVIIESRLEEPEEIFVEKEVSEENWTDDGVGVSKTVDIKHLKESIWSCLSLEKGNKENWKGKGKTGNFYSVLDQLPRVVSKTDLDNLSVHTCFIAMLHLANEKGLMLKQGEGCDFWINLGN